MVLSEKKTIENSYNTNSDFKRYVDRNYQMYGKTVEEEL